MGNGSSKSWSSTNWSIGDFYLFTVDCTGYTGELTVSLDVIRSNSGPSAWELTVAGSGPVLTVNPTVNGSWSSITPNTLSRYLVAVPSAGNVMTFSVRATAAPMQTAGTMRVDNFKVVGVPCAPPQITAQPEIQAACMGGTATFAVTATNAVSYQWRSNFQNIDTLANPSAATATLQLQNVQVPIGGPFDYFDCIVTGACGSVTSSSALLAVTPLPHISAHPQPRTACVGTSPTFSVTTSGATAYQWRRNSVNIDTQTNASAATSTLTLTNVQSSESGAVFDCVVSNGCGGTPSNTAMLTVQDAEFPSILTQPSDIGWCIDAQGNANGTWSFAVTASGNGLTYRWQYSGPLATDPWIDAPAYTGPTFGTGGPGSIPDATPRVQNRVRCIVTNSCGLSATSSIARLYLVGPAGVSAHPQPATSCPGSSASFAVAASASPAGSPVTYQWRRNGQDINSAANPSAATATLQLNGLTLADSGSQFDCTLGNACGAGATSNAAALTVAPVGPAPTITGQPTNFAWCVNAQGTAVGTINLTVIAQGAGLTYMWQESGPNAADPWTDTGFESSSTGNIVGYVNGVSPGPYRRFRCVVTSGCGQSTTSNIVTWSIVSTTTITTQPHGVSTCAGGSAQFSVAAAGGIVTYQWYQEGINQPMPGATGAELSFPIVTEASLGSYYCIVTGACGAVESEHASLYILCTNKADVAGPGQLPGCDTRITVDDLVYFLQQFFAGNPAVADLVALGNPFARDGIVTVDDLVYFLSQFFAGCP